MPRVETYGQPKVEQRPLPNARREMPTRAGSVLGATVTRIGEVALNEEQRIQELQRQRATQVENLTTLRALNELDQQLLYSPDKGLLHKKGLDAMAALDPTIASYEEQADLLASNLRTAEGRLFFEQQRLQRRDSLRTRGIDHGTRELQQYGDQQFKAFEESNVQRGISRAGDDAEVLRTIAEGQVAIEQHAERNRLAPEVRDRMIAKHTSDIHVGVINQLLAEDKDQDALRHYQRFEQAIDGGARAAVVAKVDAGSTEGTAFRLHNELWAQLGPMSDDTPAELDKLLTAAQARAGDNVKVYKATETFLRARVNTFEASRKARLDANEGPLLDALRQGQPLAAIMALPQWKTVDAATRLKIQTEHDNRIERARARLAAEDEREERKERRALNEEARLSAAAAREERDQERDNWDRYWEYAQNTEWLATATRKDINDLQFEIGVKHVNRLHADKDQFEKLGKATVDIDLVKQGLYDAGQAWAFDTGAKLSRIEKGRIGQAYALVVERIVAEQRKLGRELTPDEQRPLINQVLDQQIFVPGRTMLGFTVSGEEPFVGATVTDDIKKEIGEERLRGAYVPLEQIPADLLAEGLKVLRQYAGVQGTDAELTARYRDRLQRAYAARLLNIHRDTQIRILKGTH